MVSRLSQHSHEPHPDDPIPVDAGMPEPDRQLIGLAQSWFREIFREGQTPRAEQAWRVARMLADIEAHPACPAVALLRALPWERLRGSAIVPTLPEDVVAMLSDLDRGDRVLERLETFAPAAPALAAATVHDAEAVRKLMLALAQDVRTVVVLLAERLDMLRAAAQSDGATRRRLASQTMALHAPLANRIGVWQIKWELEDLSFRYLEPETYKNIATLLDERRTDRERWIANVIAELRGELAGRGIQGEVQGRPKHIFSIWKKMKQKGLSFAQLMDVRAVRVIVEDIDDCYAVLGLVHDKWQPIAGEFDDYIAHPKGNFYRSLHTAVLGPEQRPLEVQIRTSQMHRDSELGVAAHWRYKEGRHSDRRFDERIVWLRQMLEWGREVNAGEGGPGGSAPVDDTIYVFTPQGRVIDLPKGATPVDFAYHVHTDLGHRCRGARVDGVIVPLHYRLDSGQRVEITVARQGGPSRDWLNPELGFLHSARALAKVRHWFKQQNLEEDLAHGRQLLDKAIQRAGRGQPNLDKVAQELGLARADDLLVALARNEVPQRLLEQALDPQSHAEPLPGPDAVRQVRAPESAKGSGAIHVLGVSNIASTFAKCCRPVPPEPVVGFVTRTHGVTIHREDCASLDALSDEQRARLIPAAWGNTGSDQFAVDIAVEARDRQGLLRDISDALTREKINVTAVNTLSRGDDAHMQFTIHIANRGQLSAALKNLTAVDGVRRAYRR
ncbi:MAG: RelA/SpoT family protein [Pseudomonadota bacterium]|nr:RelA/SpoT family protein [Pseudomonadota bacterium]